MVKAYNGPGSQRYKADLVSPSERATGQLDSSHKYMASIGGVCSRNAESFTLSTVYDGVHARSGVQMSPAVMEATEETRSAGFIHSWIPIGLFRKWESVSYWLPFICK